VSAVLVASRDESETQEDGFGSELFVGLDSAQEKAARRELLEYLKEAGASDEVLKQAAREGTLATCPSSSRWPASAATR